MRVATTDEWAYVTTKKEEIWRIAIDGKGDWEKVPGWPIPLEVKVRYPDGGAERTLEFENKEELDNTTVAALLKEIAEQFKGVPNVDNPDKVTLTYGGMNITADVVRLIAAVDQRRKGAEKAGEADEA